MSDEQETEEEPSIEEILDSIRQIISDDDEEEGGEAEAPAPEPEPIDEFPQDDPEPELEPEPAPVAAAPAPEPVAAAPEPEEDIVELDQPIEAPSSPPPAPAPVSAPAGSRVLTDGASSAAYDGFSELARKTAVEHNGVTLEDVVRTELNPLLREWLDRNLPPIIDRLVKQELERIAKRAETDSDGF